MLLEVPGLPWLEQTAYLLPQTKGISKRAQLVFSSDYKKKKKIEARNSVVFNMNLAESYARFLSNTKVEDFHASKYFLVEIIAVFEYTVHWKCFISQYDKQTKH